MRVGLYLMGQPRLIDMDGTPIRVPAKGLICFAYLAGSPSHSADRKSLAQLLWPNSENASRNLRRLLWEMQHESRLSQLGILSVDNRYIRLDVSVVPCDLISLIDLLKGASTEHVSDLVTLYSGDLLDGIDGDCAELQEWLDLERGRIRELFVSHVAHALESGSSNLSAPVATLVSRKLIAVDPYNETAFRALMRIHAAAGELNQVKQAYSTLRRRLSEDLNESPTEVTQSLMRSLLERPAEQQESPSSRDISAHRSRTDSSRSASSKPSLAISNDRQKQEFRLPRITLLAPAATPQLVGELAGMLLDDIEINLMNSKLVDVISSPHLQPNQEIVDFSVQQAGDQTDYYFKSTIRFVDEVPWLYAKIIERGSDCLIWANKYAFTPDFIATSYTELLNQILGDLWMALEQDAQTIGARISGSNAYTQYMIGQRCLRSLELPSVRRARKAFRAALSEAPNFLPAVAGLSRTYHLEWLLLAQGDTDLLDLATTYAKQAIDLDPTDARGYHEFGICALRFGDFDQSQAAYANAERLLPNRADILADYADTLHHLGSTKLALEKIERAIAHNPNVPDIYWWTKAGIHFELGDYRATISSIARMRDASPAYRLLASAYALLGEQTEAQHYVAKTLELHPDFNVTRWLKIISIHEREQESHYETGLRSAGFQ